MLRAMLLQSKQKRAFIGEMLFAYTDPHHYLDDPSEYNATELSRIKRKHKQKYERKGKKAPELPGFKERIELARATKPMLDKLEGRYTTYQTPRGIHSGGDPGAFEYIESPNIYGVTGGHELGHALDFTNRPRTKEEEHLEKSEASFGEHRLDREQQATKQFLGHLQDASPKTKRDAGGRLAGAYDTYHWNDFFKDHKALHHWGKSQGIHYHEDAPEYHKMKLHAKLLQDLDPIPRGDLTGHGVKEMHQYPLTKKFIDIKSRKPGVSWPGEGEVLGGVMAGREISRMRKYLPDYVAHGKKQKKRIVARASYLTPKYREAGKKHVGEFVERSRQLFGDHAAMGAKEQVQFLQDALDNPAPHAEAHHNRLKQMVAKSKLKQNVF